MTAALCPHVDTARHPLADEGYVEACRRRLDDDGALVLAGFFRPEVVARVVADESSRVGEAFFADSTHNVYLTEPDPDLPAEHPFNRQVASSKGLLADDQVAASSPLREFYEDPSVRTFLSGVLGIDRLHPYADDVSSINVHFAGAGQELGWHFDNSAFAVTMLLQAPEGGGNFEYVPHVRGDGIDSAAEYAAVERVLDDAATVRRLDFSPGDLVVFRGRDALHRVTPTEGPATRILVVFAFNERAGVRLSDSALATFYGRVVP